MRYFNLLTLLLLTINISSCNVEEINSALENNSTDNPLVLRTMNELMEQYDNFGNLESSENPTGNMILDFCFDFVYPINFELSNGTIVTVSSIEDLIDIIINSSEDLYVNDIVYPFDVEVYNSENNSFEVITIDNEDSFELLIETCNFDEEDYLCTEEFDPVCVEINGQNNEVFIIAYPNSCWAELDGFSEDDFLEDCTYDNDFGEDDFYDEFLYEMGCGELVFPVSFQVSNGDTLTANDVESFIQLIEQWIESNPNQEDDFQFIYPITIEFESEGSIISIEILSEDMLYEVLEQYCDDDYSEDEEQEDCNFCSDEENLVCVQYENPSNPNDTIVEVFLNPCYAFCAGFSEIDFVDCE